LKASESFSPEQEQCLSGLILQHLLDVRALGSFASARSMQAPCVQ